jgi:hypothetical protein
MTTGLITRGMSMEDAAAAVVHAAEQLRAENDAPIALWTETGRESVLVGIARRGQAAATMLIPRKDYDGMKLLASLTGGGCG